LGSHLGFHSGLCFNRDLDSSNNWIFLKNGCWNSDLFEVRHSFEDWFVDVVGFVFVDDVLDDRLDEGSLSRNGGVLDSHGCVVLGVVDDVWSVDDLVWSLGELHDGSDVLELRSDCGVVVDDVGLDVEGLGSFSSAVLGGSDDLAVVLGSVRHLV